MCEKCKKRLREKANTEAAPEKQKRCSDIIGPIDRSPPPIDRMPNKFKAESKVFGMVEIQEDRSTGPLDRSTGGYNISQPESTYF